MINTVRRTRPRSNRIDPTVIREPAKPKVPCLACASRSTVATHTH